MQLATIYPNRLVIQPQRRKKSAYELYRDKIDRLQKKYVNESFKKNFEKKKSTWALSYQTKKKILDSVNTLYCLSKPRTIEMKNGKKLFNFRASFITLTLSAKQVHSDLEIKKTLLNQFFVELRKHYKVENYVWKAELQKNDNIHFHIITDRYIDFQALRRRWNRVQNKLGYIDSFSSSMNRKSFKEYYNELKKYKDISILDAHRTYQAGKKNNWLNPNSVDVKKVKSKKELAVYLSKYIVKEVSADELTENEIERITTFGRVWGRSQSLSKLKFVNKIELQDLKELINYFKLKKDKIMHVVNDYCEVFYFNISDIKRRFRNEILFYLKANARLYAYPFPV